MTTNNSNLFDMALLAEASYVLLHQLEQTFTDADINNILKNNNSGGYFTQQQADYFVANWNVKSHQANTESGFSATLFQSANDSANLVYALRGTEFGVGGFLGVD
jgi:hypothetical protein